MHLIGRFLCICSLFPFVCMWHVTAVCQFSGIFPDIHITSVSAWISSYKFFVSTLDKFCTDIFLSWWLTVLQCSYYFPYLMFCWGVQFSYLNSSSYWILKSYLKYCFHLPIINWSLPNKLSLSLQIDICGWKPAFIPWALYRILLLHLFYLLSPYLPAP